MLYKIRQDSSVFEDNPEISAIPEFAKLTDRQMKLVCLVADRRSPLRTLPERERREKAARICGWPMEGQRLDRNGRDVCAGKVESIEKAIEKFREYQFDEHQADYDAVVKQIQEIRDYLTSDKEDAKDKGKALEQAAKLGERLPSLIEAKQKLESLLQISKEQKPEIVTYSSADLPDEDFTSGEDLPAIEKFHAIKQRQE